MATQILLKFIQEAQRKSAPNIIPLHHSTRDVISVSANQNKGGTTATGPTFGSYTGRVNSQTGEEKEEHIDYNIDQQLFNSKIPEAFRSTVNPVLKYRKRVSISG